MVRADLTYGQDMRALVIAAAGLLLAGCATDVTTGGAPNEPSAPATTQTPTPTEESSPSEPEPEPEQEPEVEPEAEPSPSATEAEAVPCEEVMFQRAQGTIRSQQRALGAQDFEAARAYATDSFRESVSVADFRRIIAGTYPFLLEDPALDFRECQRQGDTALIQLDVAGSPVIAMVYRVVLENESWFIDAASIAGSREDVTT